MDSGLIFPIIVALWLVYLVPGWIRRREHLGSSRAADRFSAAMRVLDRPEERPALQPRPASGGYVLTPPRPDAASLVVKRSQPVDPAPTRTLAPSLVTPTPTRRDQATRGVIMQPLGDQATPGVIKQSTRDHAMAPRRRSRVPGLTLLAMLVALPVTVVLAVLDVVPPGVPAVPLGVLVLCVVVLRSSAIRRRRQQATRLVSPRPAAPRQATTPRGSARSGSGVLAELMSAAPVSADPDDDTSGEPWTPVPVPPPTYTLKSPAPARLPVAWSDDAVPTVPAPRSLPDAEPTPEPVTQPVARRVVPDLELVLERRRASGE